MWVLISSKGSAYTLLTGKDHVVGRKDGDLILGDDQSISRKHAVVSVQHDIKNLGDTKKLPEVILTDSQSKYGIFINDGIEKSVRIPNGSNQTLKNGDRIRFGLQWNEWRLEYRPLVVTTSTLTPAEKKSLKQHILKLGGHLVSNWQDDVTHVTMNNITLTVKVVCALARGRPIVMPEYWEQYITALSSKKPVPDYKDHIPPLAETTLNMNEVSFDINENRKNLFHGKKFIFSSEHQYRNYSCMVTAADGEALMMNSAMNLESLLKPDVIVMQYSHPRNSQDSQLPSSFEGASKYLKSKSRRLIPDSEIGLAILHCSLEKNCNPQFNIASTLLTYDSKELSSQRNVTLALDTQQQSESESMKHHKPHERIIIPESGTVRKPVSPKSSTKTDVDDDVRIIPESGTVRKSSPSRIPILPVKQEVDKDIMCIDIVKSDSSSGVKRERLSTTDEVDAAHIPHKRRKFLEEDGFLTTKNSSFSLGSTCTQSPVKVEIKIEDDDEGDMFNFSTDTANKRKHDSNVDDDMFAFAEESKVPKSVVKKATSFVSPKKKKEEKRDLSPVSFDYSKKRKNFDNEIEPICKRPATEKKSVDTHAEEAISLSGFLDTKQENKENATLDDTMAKLADGIENVTVVEVKPLVTHRIYESPKIISSGEKNFKKFRKGQAVHRYPPIKTQDMVPFDFHKKGLNDWLNDTNNATVDVENDEDDDNWDFVQPSQTRVNKSRNRRR